jgi:hypothetical protein
MAPGMKGEIKGAKKIENKLPGRERKNSYTPLLFLQSEAS